MAELLQLSEWLEFYNELVAQIDPVVQGEDAAEDSEGDHSGDEAEPDLDARGAREGGEGGGEDAVGPRRAPDLRPRGPSAHNTPESLLSVVFFVFWEGEAYRSNRAAEISRALSGERERDPSSSSRERERERERKSVYL